MLQLNADLIEKILLQLDIHDLITLSQVNRELHELVREIPSVQYKLYKSLYQSTCSLYNEGGGGKPLIGILNLVEKERNLLRLTPRIKKFGVGFNINHNHNHPGKRDQVVHSAQDDYLITVPRCERSSDLAEERFGFGGQPQQNGKYELCTLHNLLKPNSKRTIYTEFSPINHTLVVDIKRDLIVYIDTEGYIHPIHFCTQFGNSQEYVEGGMKIPSEDWSWNDRLNFDSIRIDLIEDDKLIIELGGKWWVFNWRSGDIVYRFPPNDSWESLNGSIITHHGLLIGLDIPSIPWGPNNNKPRLANLAIFNLSYPASAPYLPELLLELPYSYGLLSKTVRTLRSIPKGVKISIPSGRPPKLHDQAYNPQFVKITFPFKLIPGNSSELSIVIPIKQLGAIKIENKRKQWIKGRTWRRSSNPFDGVQAIPFENWKSRAHIWIEPTPHQDICPTLGPLHIEPDTKRPKGSGDLGEYQVGQRSFKVDRDLLNERGKLNLEISDFDHHEIINLNNQFGALKSINLDLAPKDNERPNKPRSSPQHYKVLLREATQHLPPRIRSSGQFNLGLPGEIEVLISDNNGQRLIIQQKNNHQIWILDFGV